MLTLLGAQTTEDETARRDRELEQLLLQVGRGTGRPSPNSTA